ncbi:cytochrome P450 4c3-like isoform X2 [Diabrotica undecimpunctata]|uniref:cytochrome P450 4c3-like isoform X2 n=1 Tax=Diabrotica undecimpunctata TaxID=50387 RepID=UPI003B6363B1
MTIVLTLIVGAAVAAISYWWMCIYRIRSKLHWIPEVPRLPLIGNVLELKKTTAEKWKKTRKILTPAFHFSILDDFYDTFDSNAALLINLLDKETCKDSVDVLPYLKNCTLDILCETAMGVSIHAQKYPKSDYVRAVSELCRLLIIRTYSPLKTFDFFYRFTTDYKIEMEQVKILHSHTMNVITSRREELKKKQKEEQKEKIGDVGIKQRKAFLDLLLEETIDGRPFTDTEIREEVDTFLFAGHDTTANVISFTLYCLSLNKNVQDKVAREQKQIFGENKNRKVTMRDIQEMKYLELAFKESLRIYPPAPYVGRKTDRDIAYIDGNIIPKGTGIVLAIYWANRNLKYFPDPETYNPSRFENTTGTHPYTYIPFSAGPRNCIGQKYAWNLIKSVVSTILRNYEVSPCGHKLELAAEGALLSKNGIKVKLRKRDWDRI